MTTLTLLAILLSIHPISATPSRTFTPAAQSLCANLHTQLPSIVAYSSNFNSTPSTFGFLAAAYTDATQRYNNAANRDDIPACVLFPRSAQDVSVAMKLLHGAPTVPFALKSGGHDWNRGFSSTDGGVLISFRPYLNYTKLSKDKTQVEVGPGARWIEVLTELDKDDRLAVGGRNGDVGVGGYIPKGGISFLSGEYGFGSDNVASFEVVLANGTIVNVGRDSHPDLFFALRGGGPLFGAVTKLTLLAHPVTTVWFSSKTYAYSQTSRLVSAISNFTANYNDSRAAVLPTFEHFGPTYGSTTTWSVQLLYNSPNAPPPHIFAEFNAIPYLNCTQDGQYRYVNVIGNSGSQPQFRSAGAVSSLPNLPEKDMKDFLTGMVDKAVNSTFIVNQDEDFEFFSMAFQPIPVLMQKNNLAKGPAALATHPGAGDKIWVEYTLGWGDSRADFTNMRGLRGLVDEVKVGAQEAFGGVKATNWMGGAEEDKYKPLFFNDAMWDQEVFKSYGNESYAKLREVRKAYDPQGVFLGQTSQFVL